MGGEGSSRFGVRPEKAVELQRRMAALGIHEEDLVERFVRGSGPGGQKTNKTSQTVYLKHGPSGIEVKVGTERSQSLNRFFARRLLADRIEAEVHGRPTADQLRAEKHRRQKQRRHRRAQKKAPPTPSPVDTADSDHRDPAELAHDPSPDRT